MFPTQFDASVNDGSCFQAVTRHRLGFPPALWPIGNKRNRSASASQHRMITRRSSPAGRVGSRPLVTRGTDLALSARVLSPDHLHPGFGAMAPSARTVTRSRPLVLARNMFMVA
jgi:hypothetical protein